MKKLISLFIIICANSVCASLPEIVALVNDVPVTKYDVSVRKTQVMLNNSMSITPNAMFVTNNPIDMWEKELNEKAFNNAILNSLIEEAMISQHAIQNNTIELTQHQIDGVIEDMAKSGHVSKNASINFIDIQKF